MNKQVVIIWIKKNKNDFFFFVCFRISAGSPGESKLIYSNHLKSAQAHKGYL